MVLPTSSPCRVGLLAGICWTKSQSPHYSPGLGGGGDARFQITSALCQSHLKLCIIRFVSTVECILHNKQMQFLSKIMYI